MTHDDATLHAPAQGAPVGRPLGAGASRGALAAFGVALAVHLGVLYWPHAVAAPTGFGWDKVVHALIFGAVAWTGARAGVPLRLLLPALLAHALVSEGVQHWLLPGRTGDLGDSAADACGTLLAAALLARDARRRRVR
ncbi:MAG: hypothetical protein U0Q15_17865 [Kineosporiaceae bacterium]